MILLVGTPLLFGVKDTTGKSRERCFKFSFERFYLHRGVWTKKIDSFKLASLVIDFGDNSGTSISVGIRVAFKFGIRPPQFQYQALDQALFTSTTYRDIMFLDFI